MASTSSARLSPPRKRAKRTHLSVAEKEMVLNIYKSEMLAIPEILITDIVNIVASKTGISARSVFRIVSEYKKNHKLSAPKTNQKKRNIIDTVNEFQKKVIRRIVHDFYFRNELPTMDNVLSSVNNDSDLPNFKRTTFYRILKHLKFDFKKRGVFSALIEKDEIIIWRRKFLKSIRLYRNQNKKIYYLDETWINAGHAVVKVLTDTTIQSSKQAFLDGLSTGSKNPSGKGKKQICGKKLIICLIGSKDGFVPDSLWAFESKKSGDYHEEMDGNSFEQWFSNILPKLEDNAVIVLDNASYHSRKIENFPTTATNKNDIKRWLLSKNINYDENMLKVELLGIANTYKSTHEKYVIDEMAENQNKIVLRLPPYHCELNPIELIWSKINDTVAAKNTEFKFADMKKSFLDAVEMITPEYWKQCINHIKGVEQKMWQLDNIIEAATEKIIININNDSSSDFSE